MLMRSPRILSTIRTLRGSVHTFRYLSLQKEVPEDKYKFTVSFERP